MPRFFFHIRTAAGPVIADLTGIEFADLAAAVANAEEGILERPVDDFQAILITDAAGEVVATVPFDGVSRDPFNGATSIFAAADIFDQIVRSAAGSKQAGDRPVLVTRTVALPPGHAIGFRPAPDDHLEPCFLLQPKLPGDALQ